MGSLYNSDTFRILQHALGDAEAQEALDLLAQESMDDMETFERFLHELKANDGNVSRLLGTTHKPVSIDTFIDDPYFLNLGRGEIYPKVRDAISDVINGGFIQFLAMGAIGRGKTTAAQIVTAYHVYLLSMERFPQLRFGLMPTSSIVFACLNKTADLAKLVTYAELFSLMAPIPYFQEHFPFDTGVKSMMQFPNNIRVEYHAAYSDKLLGKNVIGGIEDEMNFMAITEKSRLARDGGEFNQAKKIHASLLRRRKSRFLSRGKLPGCLCVVSSAGYAGDFMDELKAKVIAEEDTQAFPGGTTYVWDGPQWEVVPAERFSGRKFLLEIGDERHGSQIVKSRAEARSGATVWEIPIEYKQEFDDNMDDALRDICGLNIGAERPYFWDRTKVWAMATRAEQAGLVSPFTVDTTDLTEGFPEVNDAWETIPYPQRLRAMHVDLAIKKDICGIAMGYVWKTDHVRGRFSHAELSTVEEVPFVRYDFTIGIKAPKNGEIEFADVRQFIYWVRDTLGYPLRYVTFDGFQSVDSRQILKREGFQTELVSVEGVDAFEALRTAMFQERLDCPENQRGFNELCRLQEDRKHNKVDHPEPGSKDIADGMAGVYKTLVTRRESWSPAPAQGPMLVMQDGRPIGARSIPTTIRRASVRRNVERK